VSAWADALTLGRLLAAVVLPVLLRRGGSLPLVVFAMAALSDFVDGRLARRAARPTRHGAVLDNVADVAFVLAGTITTAVAGLTSWAVPVSIALSAGSYAAASARLTAGASAPRLARSTLGHAAGVCNYACVGLAAGAIATPGAFWPSVLAVGDAATVLVNVAAVTARWTNRASPVPDDASLLRP
jgi:phosphatidylglycerophosphate synthase